MQHSPRFVVTRFIRGTTTERSYVPTGTDT